MSAQDSPVVATIRNGILMQCEGCRYDAAGRFIKVSDACSLHGDASGALTALTRITDELDRYRLELARLYDAVQTENFNRSGKREMSNGLRAQLRQARALLDEENELRQAIFNA